MCFLRGLYLQIHPDPMHVVWIATSQTGQNTHFVSSGSGSSGSLYFNPHLAQINPDLPSIRGKAQSFLPNSPGWGVGLKSPSSSSICSCYSGSLTWSFRFTRFFGCSFWGGAFLFSETDLLALLCALRDLSLSKLSVASLSCSFMNFMLSGDVYNRLGGLAHGVLFDEYIVGTGLISSRFFLSESTTCK